ncbi:MAG TPA: pyridoxamine 5'-phosphate oxidase family protein [Candidatus Limnocylindrales bacterium]|nr:pyridoxamine 5'-phosphate oxidase family protein [Candidatus Limnocylindrales bacterium]
MDPTPSALPDPHASRPRFPEGYGVPTTDEGLLPWSWARRELDRSLVYWLVTVDPDGGPHAIPIWGAWVDDRFYCEGSPQTRYARNIARDPRVVVHLGSGDDVVIVEGTATLLEALDPELVSRVQAGYAKYKEAKDYEPDPAGWPGALWEVRPRRARGWRRLDEATRWTWER